MAAKTIKLSTEISIYNSNGNPIGTIQQGTEIEVSDAIQSNGMVSVIYTTAEGGMASAFCKSSDFGEKVHFDKAAKSAPPSRSTEATPEEKPSSESEEEGWMSDHAQALRMAESEKKMLLMDFTGSDWCGWCIKLDKEIFSRSEFKDYAGKYLILLKLDFPHRKVLSDAVRQQNQELAQKYGIRGYPTVIVLDSNGKQLGQLGYMQGGPSAFIAELEKLRKKT